MGASHFSSASVLNLFLLYFVNLSCCLTPVNEQEDFPAPNCSSKCPPSYYQRQLQLLKLYNNFICMTDDDVRELSESFDPLKNLHLYKNPESVQEFFEGLNTGSFLGKNNHYRIKMRPDMPDDSFLPIFRILLSIDDWDLFYKTSAYALARVHQESFFLALNPIVSSKYAHEYFRTPPTYEVLPQLFAPKHLIYSYNGIESPQINLTNGEEDKLSYFRESPSLNEFHAAWHDNFPYWWKYSADGIIKDRGGEFFMYVGTVGTQYMHRQLINRYRAERISVGGLGDVLPLSLDGEISTGYVPNVLNSDFEEVPIRFGNAKLMDIPGEVTVEEVQSFVSSLKDAISKGMFQTVTGKNISLDSNAGYNLVGATIESSMYSANPRLYGFLHIHIHALLGALRDPDGSLKLPQAGIMFTHTSVRDPVFFNIHTLLDEFYALQSRNLQPYTENDIHLKGVDLKSVWITGEEENETPHLEEQTHTPIFMLETFFEDFSFDISKGIISCNKPPLNRKATATIKRHNHKPFKYHLKVHSLKSGEMNATVRIYKSPLKDYEGKVYPDKQLYANMFEMDRFPITISKGDNTIVRSSRNSAVTIPDGIPIEQLMKETREALAAGKNRPYDESFRSSRDCGYPHHLLVPKGTREGQVFKMFVIVTKDQELWKQNYRGISYCGVPRGTFTDKEVMGFPFDRKVNFDLSRSMSDNQNYKFIDVIVRLKE